jgi:small subunit ribosomal protein S20
VPQHKSAVKRMHQEGKRRRRNRKIKSSMREAIKKVKKIEDKKKVLPQAYSLIDKAAGKGVIHRNTAARKKSRLTKLVVSSEIKPQSDTKDKSPKAEEV